MDKPGVYRVRVTPSVDLYQKSNGGIVQEYNPDHPTSWNYCVQWGWIENQKIQVWNDTLTVAAMLGYFETETLPLAEVSYDYSNGIP